MLQIEPMTSNAFAYFVRVEGTPDAIKKDLRELFLEDSSKLVPIALGGRTDEFGFITDVMFEGDFLQNVREFEEKTGRRVFHFIRTEKEED